MVNEIIQMLEDILYEASFVLRVCCGYALIGLGIAVFVLPRLGMYAIAKRRGLVNPWLAWIPVADAYVLGSISDQYRFVAEGQTTNHCKRLLVLRILCVVTDAVFGVCSMILGFALFAVFVSAGQLLQVDEITAFGKWVILVMAILCVGCLCVYILFAICHYKSLYDLYRSCRPEKSKVYLVLSILLGVLESIFIYACREKDEGMPPRNAAFAADAASEPVQQSEQETEG